MLNNHFSIAVIINIDALRGPIIDSCALNASFGSLSPLTVYDEPTVRIT